MGRRIWLKAGLSLALATVAAGVSAQTAEHGFLAHPLDVKAWLPAAPLPASVAEAEDEAVYLHTRPLLDTPRGAEAAADNVYTPDAVAPRFSEALGAALTPKDTPLTLALIGRVVKDAEALVAPIKQPAPPAGSGRVRPFVAFGGKTCPLRPDDFKFHLRESGSYPSTHAALGWIWTSVLTALAPERADRLIARGISFGESRVICGFHYRSDVEAGRLAAAALMAREAAEPGFQAALAAARREFEARRGR